MAPQLTTLASTGRSANMATVQERAEKRNMHDQPVGRLRAARAMPQASSLRALGCRCSACRWGRLQFHLRIRDTTALKSHVLEAQRKMNRIVARDRIGKQLTAWTRVQNLSGPGGLCNVHGDPRFCRPLIG